MGKTKAGVHTVLVNTLQEATLYTCMMTDNFQEVKTSSAT